ncbi:MAG: glycoside hydrolase family 30 protein [Polyangiaceae bacterium]|nr:glycoside hydrolase family 30 protein [Polyangiaceae bacterium]
MGLSCVFLAAGCGGTESSPSSSSADETGGQAALAGGTSGSGGTGLVSSGGTAPTTGGSASTTGSTAGAAGSGGVVGSGGASPLGGAPTIGGVSTNGGTSSGGDPSGGSGPGGRPTGGASSGGAGGGGTETGGVEDRGGASSGGSEPGSGGDAAGGAETGGGTPVEPLLITSAEGDYWNTDAPLTMGASGPTTLTVDENTMFQQWDGFGGTFNEMGWDALQTIDSEITHVLTLLFDAQDGANFVYGRVPIGASDYSMSWYTLAETANDYGMDHFSIDRDREMLIPFIEAALEVRPDLRLWGSPWVVPNWMMDGGRNMRSDVQTQQAHALYLAKFVEEYGKEGITIEAVHPQNEPGYARVHWGQQLLIDYFKTYLGPTFVEHGLTAEIWCGTMSHPDDANIAVGVANDSEAMQYVAGFGLQWNHVDTVAALAPKGLVMQTEHRCGNYSFSAPYWDQSRYSSTTPQNDHLYGEESWQLIRDWIVGGVNSYLAWNMVLDTQGRSLDGWPQNALLVVDRSARRLVVTPAYYAFRHYSQYILPGATRIGISGTNDAVAFKNPDGSIVTEIYNQDNATQDTTVSVGGSSYQFEVPAHGWATLRVTP